jgi:DNA polymerase III alpha subunit (gram-positive type)
MPNEEILTVLRNSIEHGDSLESSMQIMINSGYNLQEVQEASKFISSGSLNIQEQKPDEELTMPEQKKSFVSKLMFWKKQNKNQIQKPSESMKLSSTSLNQKKNNISKTEEIQQQTIQQPTQIQQQPQIPQQIPTQQIQQPQQQLISQQPQQPIPQQIPTQQISQQVQRAQVPQQTQITPQIQTIPQTPPIPIPGELSKDLQKIKPQKKSRKKEIILLIILLILIGTLALSIIYRQTILGWFGV